jgi:uncharacterized membrane protein
MLTSLLESWSSIYSNHAALRTAIEFAHVGGLVAGGGCAVAADLATINAARNPIAARRAELRLIKRTHGIVLWSLVAIAVSGVLLFGADADTYWHSRIFWLKMALVAVLLANGTWLLAGERRVERDEAGAWARLHVAAVCSVVLWLLTTLAGSALPNIG